MPKRWILAVLVFVLCLSTLLAQQITVDVKLVTLVATVTDSAGRNIPDLQPEDFVVEEDGKPQTITLLEQSDNVPVSMGVVLDTSGSMESKINTATASIDRFLQSIEPDDDIFLMSFARGTRLEQDFTNDRKKISSALRRVKLGSGTSIYDAVEKSLRKVREGQHDRKAILLVTDGQDNSSLISFDDALRYVRGSEVLVYCLGIGPSGTNRDSTRIPPQTNPRPGQGGPPIGVPGGPNGGPSRGPVISLPGGIRIPLPGTLENQFQYPGGNRSGSSDLDTVDMRVLDEIAEASGGKAWLITSSSANGSNPRLDDALDEIAAELRSQYTIGYHPTHAMDDGKWHQVEVRTRNARYTVRSRKEYFGGDNPDK